MCIFCDNMISNNNLHKKGSQITIYKSCKQESRTPNCKIWSRLSTSLFYCWLVVWTSRNRNNAPKIIILGSHAFSESAPFPLLRLSLDIRLNRVQNYAFGSITTGLCIIQCQHLMDNGQYKSSLLIIDWFSWWHILVSLGFSFSPPGLQWAVTPGGDSDVFQESEKVSTAPTSAFSLLQRLLLWSRDL